MKVSIAKSRKTPLRKCWVHNPKRCILGLSSLFLCNFLPVAFPLFIFIHNSYFFPPRPLPPIVFCILYIPVMIRLYNVYILGSSRWYTSLTRTSTTGLRASWLRRGSTLSTTGSTIEHGNYLYFSLFGVSLSFFHTYTHSISLSWFLQRRIFILFITFSLTHTDNYRALCVCIIVWARYLSPLASIRHLYLPVTLFVCFSACLLLYINQYVGNMWFIYSLL